MLKRRLNAKSMGEFTVKQIVLDYIGIDSILFDPAVSDIFYFKHDAGASSVIIFIGNPDVDSLKCRKQRKSLEHQQKRSQNRHA